MAIVYDEGKRVKDYVKSTGIPKSSIERYLKLLRDAGLIQFIGDAPQTGGYYLMEQLKKEVNKK